MADCPTLFGEWKEAQCTIGWEYMHDHQTPAEAYLQGAQDFAKFLNVDRPSHVVEFLLIEHGTKTLLHSFSSLEKAIVALRDCAGEAKLYVASDLQCEKRHVEQSHPPVETTPPETLG